ncbi:MAG: DEAD/DEAH box helicase, partial [Ilumatobacteraceae bacterium]|nr:DEAD/DEAH box helicase [Ilumatobacteraceae bacterium]
MTQLSAETVRSQFIQRLKYAPDRFQVEAMNSLDAGASVLVAAPTGSGKTLVAEYAINQAMASEQRSFYTAPIKALSNQKYRDLCDLYGSDKVGLVTGDNAINSEAPIVVMTTEVLRNMIYSSSPRLEQLGVVVLDEVHFLQDTYRGPVWEEVIIQLPLEVQLVCLSATVSNADEVGTWLTTVRGRTDVIIESKRPVELVNHFALGDSSTERVSMYDTIVNGEANGSVRRLLDSERSMGRSGKVRGRGHRQRFYTPSRPDLVDLLSSEDLLPAIVFIFSRAQCEDAVNACIRDGIVLTDPEEEARIIQIINDKTCDLTPDDRIALRYDDFLEQAGAGISCHHAGMIPMFKEAIEQCFIEGLVKVVFATETLAVGINMPARAVVIEKLTKFTGENHMLLKASEFAQLTGRAGRRGLDDIGHAVTLWNPFITFDQIVALALSRSFRLSSAFRPTFNMAVNLVRAHTRQGTHHVLNLSFAQFQTDKDVVLSEANLQSKKLAALELSRTATGSLQD